MAKLGWRVKSLAWVLAHAPGSSVSQMSAEQVVRAQQRLAGHGRLAVGVVGRLAKGVVTDNHWIGRDDHDLPIRIYRPVGMSAGGPVIVHFHGGGWTQGPGKVIGGVL
jgi:acetyl esterase/lipase